MGALSEEANALAFKRLVEADPVIIDIQRAGDVLPGMKPNMVLISGPPLPWEQYFGAHRMAILYGSVHEGLARTVEEAEEKIRAGEILVESTHAHGVAGAHTSIHTASMPVYVIEDRASGARGHCTPFEGDGPTRINQGTYGEDSAERLRFVAEVLGPTLGAAIRRRGGIPIVPIIRRALHLGDELHLRTTAATLLFTRELFPALLDLARERDADVRRTLDFLATADHTFVRIALATVKAISNSFAGVKGSSLVTVMSQSCSDFGIQVSGLGDQWFRCSVHSTLEGEQAESGDEQWDRGQYGTDSIIAEVVGLGAFASAAAFGLLNWLHAPAEGLVQRTVSMYPITQGEHPEFKIPYLNYRGVPAGIDVFKVLEAGVTPLFHGFLPYKSRIAVGAWRAPIEVFQAAGAAYNERYG